MKKILYPLFFAITIFISCSKHKESHPYYIALPEPVKAAIDANTDKCNACGLRVNLIRFRNELVHEVDVSGPTCNSVIVYYDEAGTEHLVTPDVFSEYMETRKVIKVIWSCTP